jgi:hypothetical protein
MKVKKQVFKVLSLIIILFCFVTCSSSHDDFDNGITNPLNGMTVTVYLDGNAPQFNAAANRAARALTPELAKMGCDYFEVTFLHNNKVARGEWSAGRVAGISGVERDVDYGGISAAPATGGSAILFAGKSDKTLMAVGRLTSVNNGSGNTAATLITAETKSVTFTLAAITAAAAVPNGPSGSNFTPNSFFTAYRDDDGSYKNVSPANTRVDGVKIFNETTKFFPSFRLERDRVVNAEYVFKLHSEAGGALGDYGILVAPSAFGAPIPGLPTQPPDTNHAIIEKKLPRYTSYGANGQPVDNYHESILLLSEYTKVWLENNNTPDVVFDPAVKFMLDTTDPLVVNGGVFSLVFSIPVYALSDRDENGNAGANGPPSRWFIRSSYGPSLYDLDDGTQGMGGAILINVGDPITYGTIDIIIREKTDKYRYYIAPPSPPVASWLADRIFDITGLDVWLRHKDGNLIRRLDYIELDFIIGDKIVFPRWLASSPGSGGTVQPYLNTQLYEFESNAFGCLEVTVQYHHEETDQTVSATFYILVDGGGYSFTTFSRVIHIFNGVNAVWNTQNGVAAGTNTQAQFRFTDLLQTVPMNTSTLVILHDSFNINDVAMNVGVGGTGPGPRLFFVVSATPGLIMGRSLTTGRGAYIRHIIDSPPGINGLNSWFFGDWPFKTDVMINGIAYPGNTEPYTVHSAGVWTSTASVYTNKMITDLWAADYGGPGGGIYNVKVGPGATVIPRVYYEEYKVSRYPLLH